MVTLKAKGDTPIQKLAGAIAYSLRNNDDVCISVVGATALNQAIKATIVARRFLKNDEKPIDLIVQPEFKVQVFSEEEKGVTTVALHIYKSEYVEERSVSTEIPSKK